MPPTLPTIASFWFGSDLSWLEALCIQSYLDRGHRFVLYTAHKVDGIPERAEQRPAEDILWPAPFEMPSDDRLRVAVFSDLFRLHLSQKTDFIWVDLDAYCIRAFDFTTPFVFATEHTGTFPTGVLRLPSDSETLALMLEFLTSANPTQPWRGRPLHRRNRQRVKNGVTWGIEALPWGSSGPKAFGHFLLKTDEDHHAMPADTFYPLSKHDLWKLHDPRVATSEIERDSVHSVHIYGHQKRFMAQNTGGLPVPGSYLSMLCERHGIDPADRPIRPVGWLAPARPSS